MYKGIVLYDKKDSEYNSWFIDKIISEGEKEGLKIELVLTEDIAVDVDEAGKKTHIVDEYKVYDFAIMRNRNPYIAASLEQVGLRCFNKWQLIWLGNDKWRMYQLLEKQFPLMRTSTVRFNYPFILKLRRGHGGRNVFFVEDSDAYENTKKIIWDEYVRECSENGLDIEFGDARKLLGERYIFQVPASEKGRDIRVYVLGGKILTAMERTSDTDFRANYSLGGKASEYTLMSDELELVNSVIELLNPDFAGIDLIYHKGKPVLNEIEDAVGTRMLYEYTDIDAVKEYMKYIKNTMQDLNDKQ